jgi:hypothetical protein
MTLPPLSSETLDAVYLHAMRQHLEKVLWRARHEVSFFRKEIESLTQQEALSPRCREAYGHMVEALSRIEQAIREEDRQELDPYSKRLCRSLRQEKNPPSELVAAAQHAIVQINEAEDRLVRVVESRQKALLEHAEQGLIDWSMPFDYEFFLLLDSGEARSFYEACADGEEPLRIYLPRHLYSPDEPTRRGKYNWNFFQNCEGHPLRAGHETARSNL